MADGPTEPEPDDGGRPEEGPILSPEELDIEESDHVEELDEGRFVVSPEARTDGTTNTQQQSGHEPARQPEPAPDDSSTELNERAVHDWLRDSFDGTSSRYGFDVTATFDGSVSQRRMASNDVVTIFESLVLWYAQQVDSDTPVEEVLGILLREANVPIRYPPQSLKALVKSTELGPDDTIAELLAAIDENEGLKL